MAKTSENWEKLRDYVSYTLRTLNRVNNPTAEQGGMIDAYSDVLKAMSACERLEKKLDKA